MAMAMQHVCIIGGGFGGVYAALELANKAPESIRVTVVDSKERFVFLPLLYELATGTATLFEVAPRFVDVFRDTRIEFVQATATSVDVEKRTATVVCSSNGMSSRRTCGQFIQASVKCNDSGMRVCAEREISFDVAVVAVGSSPRLDVVQGAMEHSLPFYSVSDAFRLQKELSRLERSDKTIVRVPELIRRTCTRTLTAPQVTVVGAGYSGVELACNVAARLGKERCACPSPAESLIILIHSVAEHL
jgi:NADH dehydrogenase FAD-containing subunit